MTWEETIQYIRTRPEYKDLVEKAYFEENLPLNVERFRKTEEFQETLLYIRKYQPKAKTILDIGSGNGVSAIAFALEGYTVTSIEPDPSDTIGAEAIRKLKLHYKLTNIEIHESFAEEIKFDDAIFDVVYARQCMHHAYNLQSFVKEGARVLKKGGLFFTVRDHVVFNIQDKELFLTSHPLQKYYGGENAFSPAEYREAIENAHLRIEKELRFYDSVINYFPMTLESIEEVVKDREIKKKNKVKQKLKILNTIPFFRNLAMQILEKKWPKVLDEVQVPGRMYSYIALKE
jgi:ubiquinone/menaquinone biosynthesis C-methylase UbiE